MRSARRRRTDALAAGDSLTRYLQDIGRYRLLTVVEERELARRAREGDALALERLVCANLRFVVSVAKRHQNSGVPLADLINEGNIGLMRAATRFDADRGVRFISYAVWWIRQAILQSVAHGGHAVRLPMGRVSVMHRVNRRVNALRQELGREPTQDEVAQDTGMRDGESADAALALVRADVSLDAPLGPDAAVSLADRLPDDAAPAPDAGVVERGLDESLQAAFGRLSRREEMVLRLHFGFDDHDPMTLESIGEQLGVTRERVRQIKEKALQRLRKSPQAVALLQFQER